MPKKIGNKDTLRHIKYKQQLKNRGGKLPVPGVVDLIVVGNGAKGSPKSLAVLTECNRYLFNCGEGTQRIIAEHKLKISRMDTIFITHRSWDNVGGLIGMALTLQSTNVPLLRICGPPGVENTTTKANKFSQLTNLQIEKLDMSASFEDAAMKVDMVILHKTVGIDSSNHGDTGNNSQEPKKLKLDVSDDECTMAYICTPHQSLGKLDLEKAVNLGIPRGPILGRLKNGETITLDNGKVINPEDVLTNPEPVLPFIVIEIPTVDHLDALLCAEQFKPYQSRGDNNHPDIIVHMTSNSIMADSKYQEWISRFSPETKHLVLNETNNGVGEKALYRLQAKLNQLHEGIFPLLPKQISMDKVRYFEEVESESNRIKGYVNLKYQLKPRKGFNNDSCVELDNESFRMETTELEGFAEDVEQLKQKLSTHSAPSAQGISDRSRYPEVIFLGTGSSQPSKERNVSSILLQLGKEDCMFLDCGEGTFNQLCRFYGDEVDSILRKLSCVFVSHMHADHHLGLIGLLHARQEAFRKSGEQSKVLHLIAPFSLFYWLQSVDQELFPLWQDLEFFSCKRIVSKELEAERLDKYHKLMEHLKFKEILPVPVRHCANAYGLVLSHENGWKLVYSGDTMPCMALVEAGKDCDLLIHEATMEDGMEDDARIKTHSTTSQAIDIGMKMNARFILLNHFSQRYAKIPLFNEKFCGKVGISFDNMRVRLNDLPVLPYFLPPLKSMFAEYYADMEEKTHKRNLRKMWEEKEDQNKDDNKSKLSQNLAQSSSS